MNRAVWLLSLSLLGVSLLTSACQPASADTQVTPGGDSAQAAQTAQFSESAQNVTAEPTINFDELDEQSGPTAIPLPTTIAWDRDPSAIVFRAEISGDDAGDTAETAYIRNEVPPCTVYGDNRVVWTTTNIRTDDGVVFDRVTDDAVRDFIIRLIAIHNFYGYSNSLQATPDVSGAVPVLERLTLTINDERYVTDAFSGWDYTYFREVLEACRRISAAPIAFQPQGAWVTVRNLGYNPNRPSLYWDAEANGLRLADLATSSPQWMTGERITLFWEMIRSGGIDILLQDSGSDYLVTVEVPNITRNSPPAPSS